MSLRDLVVLLDGSARDDTKLAVALGLARRHDAHLTGLCPLELLLPADMSFALGGYPDLWALPEFAKKIESQARTKAALIEAKFREVLRREGIKGDWLFETGSLIQAVVHRAQVADLMVIGQADPDNPPPAAARTLVEDLLMTAGRPLLLIPYAGRFDAIGTTVLVGWTPTRESARAVHDALPLFVPSAKVTVLTVESSGAALTPRCCRRPISPNIWRVTGWMSRRPEPWCPTGCRPPMRCWTMPPTSGPTCWWSAVTGIRGRAR